LLKNTKLFLDKHLEAITVTETNLKIVTGIIEGDRGWQKQHLYGTKHT